ncbi:MAG: M16 family metallopeptidase, partial [Nodosilinea sp.]
MSPPFSTPPSPSAPVTPSLGHSPGLHRTIFPNGLTLVVLENPLADIVSARLFIASGHSLETPANTGLMSFLMTLLTRGTSQLSAAAIAEMVESVGAQLSTDAAADYSVVSLKTVSADFEAIFTLATEVLRDPSFPEAEIELERRLTLQYLRSLQEQPFTVAFNQLRQQMYGNHPYALPGLGSETSLAALQRSDLVAWHRQQVRPDNLVITMVGHLRPEAAVALVERTLGDWSCPESPPPQVNFPPITPGHPWTVMPQATKQAVVMLGYGAASVQ